MKRASVKIILMKEINRKSKLDDIKINMKQDHEVQYWTRKWGITDLQLETAVKAAGTSVVKHVEEYLRQTGKL
jgi:hypothetical protein